MRKLTCIRRFVVNVVLPGTCCINCSGSSVNPTPGTQVGGETSTGGTTVASSTMASGGGGVGPAGAAGGTKSASGGVTASGGQPSSGGALATGAAVASGGSTGGAPATGGSKPAAGAPATGGANAAGGSKATGGGPATGGTSSTSAAKYIRNDTFWKDTSSTPIYSQGGGVLQVGATFYWYGVKYNGAVTYAANPTGKTSDTSFAGVTIYSFN